MAVKWRISPELNDGDHCGIVRTPQQVAAAVQAWADSCDDEDREIGDGFSVRAIEMSDEQFDALPDM